MSSISWVLTLVLTRHYFGSLDPDFYGTGLKQTRPAFGGNLMATIICLKTMPQMSTVRPGVMQKRERVSGTTGELIQIKPGKYSRDTSLKHLFPLGCTPLSVWPKPRTYCFYPSKGMPGPSHISSALIVSNSLIRSNRETR